MRWRDLSLRRITQHLESFAHLLTLSISTSTQSKRVTARCSYVSKLALGSSSLAVGCCWLEFIRVCFKCLCLVRLPHCRRGKKDIQKNERDEQSSVVASTEIPRTSYNVNPTGIGGQKVASVKVAGRADTKRNCHVSASLCKAYQQVQVCLKPLDANSPFCRSSSFHRRRGTV